MTPPESDGQSGRADRNIRSPKTGQHVCMCLFRLESYFNVFTMYFIMSSSIKTTSTTSLSHTVEIVTKKK